MAIENKDAKTSGLKWSDEVTQGGIGNCYLIAALSATAMYPELIDKLLVNGEKNNAGIYNV